MMKCRLAAVALAVVLAATSCMDWTEDVEPEEFHASGRGLFIACEGNFQYGNASLSYYDIANRTTINNVFFLANMMKLGDVAQSVTVYDDKCWVVVNNSHAIFAIDTHTFKEQGRIVNLTSPRYIHFIDSHKAYITQLWDNRIFIFDPTAFKITGHITVPGMDPGNASTEQMVQWGKWVFCNCWSYQNSILKIDTDTDEVVESLTVGIQPNSIVLDCNGKIWAICDGGFEGSPYGNEAPSLYCIDAATFSIEKQFHFAKGSSPRSLQLSGDGHTIYWINDAVWRMDVDAQVLPLQPFLESRHTKYYGLAIDPDNSQVYVADAIDYQQPGMVYRYSPQGELYDKFYVGITPGAFCFVNN